MIVSALVGVVLGIFMVAWVEPTTPGGVLILILLPTLLLTVLAGIIRLVVRLLETFAPGR